MLFRSIDIGGTAAIGHSFEPEVGATIQGEYLFTNLLRDDNEDGVGDLTLVEAAFTALPYLSWSEVLIGDPLMRLRAGSGGLVDIAPHPGDVNGDNYVGFDDAVLVLAAFDTVIGGNGYCVPADLTQDGYIDGNDLSQVMDHYNTSY